jgi:hypothetical protein
MKHLCLRQKLSVILLTLFPVFALSGCFYGRYAESLYRDTCNSRAYVQLGLEEYLKKRYPKYSPVRLAVVPFSVPANLASTGSEFPGVGNTLASKVQADLLASGAVPMVEVLNRVDWPGKKDEFFTGNFGALSLAREAGYDLVLVGFLERMTKLSVMSAHTKLIDVESGVTIWYGQSTVDNLSPHYQRGQPWWLLGTFWWHGREEPSNLELEPLQKDLARCIVQGVLTVETKQE